MRRLIVSTFLQEVRVMDGTQQRSGRILIIERAFESSRLAPQRMAAAYTQVLPRAPRAGPAPSPLRREEGGADTCYSDARKAMGV